MQTTRAGRVHSAAKESFLCLCAVSFLAALLLTSASGAPDPTTNKNAILVDLDCDGYHVIASGIFQSHSPTFLVVSSELPGVDPGVPRQRSALTPGTTLLEQVSRSRPFEHRESSGAHQRTAVEGVRLCTPMLRRCG
jgi:hypothetical protein